MRLLGRTAPTLTFRELFDQHLSFVWRSLRRLGVHPVDLEDQCQEVFMTVVRKYSSFEARSSLRTWIYGICVRTVSHYHRAANRRPRHIDGNLEDLGLAADGCDPDRRVLLDDLDRALDSLDSDQRAVFVLYELEEEPMPKVAEALGCPLQTAYSRLYAARREIQRAFAEQDAPLARAQQ